MTFDSDYRIKHNEKYHSEMIAAHPTSFQALYSALAYSMEKGLG